MSIEVISIVVTSVSIVVTVWSIIRERRALAEVKRLRRFLDFKKMEEFSLRYRDALGSYTKRVNRPKWQDDIQGKDIVGDIEISLTEFNTYLPRFEYYRRNRLVSAIDDAKREFPKIRKGEESVRDINLRRLNSIDRELNAELDSQRGDFMDVI